jgi:hypothetical protein
MSSAAGETEVDVCCANCGIAGVDDVKLEECNDCDLVKYCSDKCREEHRWMQSSSQCREEHREEHDRKLFSQPDGTHHGECPICFLPLPDDPDKRAFHSCCSKTICQGCVVANFLSNGDRNCPFCREPVATDAEESHKRMMERVKANDPVALRQMGWRCYTEGDLDGAFEYYSKAAELGDFMAHNQLGDMYWRGQGVEQDTEKAVYHYEKAAIGGHPTARNNLGYYEEKNRNVERAVKHYIIAANLGSEQAMKTLWKHYSAGNITKEDLDATLRTHQAAIDSTKSEERKVAERGVSESKADYWRRIGLV